MRVAILRRSIVVVTLGLAAVCSAQIYAGAAVGAGGAHVPFGSYGVMSMDGRALGKTARTAQPMVGIEVAFAIVPKLTLGLEAARSRVAFGTPTEDTVRVNWAGSYRF